MFNNDFWLKIEVKFMEYELLLGDLRFPSSEDIELHQLSYQTAGSIPSNREALFFAQSKNRLISIGPALKKLGIPIPHTWGEAPALKQIKPLRDQIARAIREQEFTSDFILLWGEYNFACAAVMALTQADDIHMYDQSNVQNNMPEILEQCIFAFWMQKHWIESGSKKRKAQDDLADAILKVLDNKHDYKTWKIAAMRNMLDDAGVKASITNLSRVEIQKLVNRYIEYKQVFEI